MIFLPSNSEVPDNILLAFSRKIKPEQFFEFGGKLGLSKTELEHIQHRTLSNRKDANIQMLSKWKASQTSGNKATQTLKLVWESVNAVPKVENLEDLGKTITNMPNSILCKTIFSISFYLPKSSWKKMFTGQEESCVLVWMNTIYP